MRATLIIFVSLCAHVALGQVSSWKYKDSESVAKKLIEMEDYNTETFAIYEKNVRFSYEWDDTENIPIVVEEGDVSVVALVGLVNYFGSFPENEFMELDYVKGVFEDGRNYELLNFSRSQEEEGIFHAGGSLQGFLIRGSNSKFGEIKKYHYRFIYKDAKFFTAEYLQSGLYTNKGKTEIWVPEWMDAEVLEYNFGGYKIKRSKDKNQEWKSRDGFSDLDDEKYTVYTYDCEDVDAYEHEAYLPGPSYYIPHLFFLNKGTHRSGHTENLYSSVDDLYTWYASLVNELNEEPGEDLTRIADSLTSGLSNDLDKIKKVFYWVQDNIRYIAFEDGLAGFKPEEATNVCNYRYGDCKGMANLTKAMLKHLGFDARLTWLGTRHVMYNYKTPSLAVDNHVICTVFYNGKKYFLDPTEEYEAMNHYAHRIQGRQVLIEDGDKYIMDSIPTYDASENKFSTHIQCRYADGKLVGHEKRNYKGESKVNVLSSYARLRSDSRKEALATFLERGDKNLSVAKVETSDLENRDDDLNMSFDFEMRNNTMNFEGMLTVDLNLTKDFYYLAIDKKRKAPFEFSSKKYYETTTEFVVPSGYTVSQLPENLQIDGDGYTFSLGYTVQGNKIIFTKLFIIENTLISKKQFADWNSDIEALRAVYDQLIILKKV